MRELEGLRGVGEVGLRRSRGGGNRGSRGVEVVHGL